MTTEHRRAPRREVVEITRTGKWGKVTYQHRLSCGHIESRPRAATSPTLACAWCLRASEKDKEMLSLAPPQGVNVFFEQEEEQSITDFDFFVEKLRSGIASKFSIPTDAVDIAVVDSNGKFVIKSAVVFLSPSDVARLGGP
jgi:hypothetical protein